MRYGARDGLRQIGISRGLQGSMALYTVERFEL